MKVRSGNADILKFIAALMLMQHHVYHIGIAVGTYPFYDAWIMVEMFLMITGFYTARHFDGRNSDNREKEAVRYTIKKFLPLLPYSIVVCFLGWAMNTIVNMIQYKSVETQVFFLDFLENCPLEMMMLSDTYTRPLIAPVWYLSALLMVFPFFVRFVQSRNRYLIMIVSFFAPIMYYGWVDFGTDAFPHDMFRAFAGLLLGALLYEISYVFGEGIAKIPKILLTIWEVLALLFVIIGCQHNLGRYRLYVLCIFLGLQVLLPGFSYSANLKGKFWNYLGKLSMPIFMIHWFVGTVVSMLSKTYLWGESFRLVVYYGVTLAVSAVFMCVLDHWKWFQRILHSPLELKD